MNRMFPPNSQGQLINQTASVVWNEVMQVTDYLIDLHSDPYSAIPFTAVATLGDEDTHARSIELAEAFGVAYADAVPDTAFVAYGQSLGKPGIVVEFVDRVYLDRGDIEVGVVGITNILKHLGMVDGSQRKQPEEFRLGGPFGFSFVYPSVGGVAHFTARPGDRVSVGEKLGVIRDAFGDVVEQLESPSDGILAAVLAFPKSPLVGTGDTLATILTKPED
jgi:predicted deacylase